MKTKLKINKLAALFLCFVIATSCLTLCVSADEEIDPPAFDLTAELEKMELKAISGNIMVGAGESGTIQIPLSVSYMNAFYNVYADEITAALSPTQVNELPFTFKTSIVQNLSPIASGGSDYAEYVVDVPADSKPGVYTFDMTVNYKISYYNFNGFVSEKISSSAKTLTVPVYVEIVNEYYDDLTASNPFDMLNSIVPDKITIGEECNVGIVLKNLTRVDLKNVNVSIEPAAGFYFVDDTNSKTIDISSDDIADVRFRVMAASDVTSGSVQFKFNVSYENVAGNSITKTYYAIVNVPAGLAAAKAELEITDIKLPTNVDAGKEFTVTLNVKNKSKYDAQNAQLVFQNDFSLINKTADNPFAVLIKAGETKSFSVTYLVPEDASTTYCPIKISLSYATSGSAEITNVSSASGTLINAKAKPDIQISNTIASSVVAGGSFKVEVVIKNNGGDASNLTLTVSSQSGGIVPTSQSTIQIPKLASGATISKAITFTTDKTASNGSNLILINIENGGVTTQQYTSINVINKEETPTEDQNIPVVIISDYEFGEDVYGGGTFTLTMEFYNTSKTQAVKDMKVTVDNADSTAVFTPVSSSNTFFIETLAAGAKIKKSIELSVASAIDPKSYGISVSFEYKNTSGASKTDAEKITVPVMQKLRFNVGEISSLTDITTNEEAYLTVNFGNLGMSTIYNVVVKVDGEGFFAYTPEYYAGNIESGKNLTNDFYLSPAGAGQAIGTVTYTYEDSSGEKFTETQDFSFFINDANGGDIGVIDPNDDVPVFDENGNPIDQSMEENPSDENKGFFGLDWWVWLCIGGAVVIIATVVVIIVVKKKRSVNADEVY